MARIAGENELVRRLRMLLFGEPTRTVSLDRSIDLLSSPATHYLGPEWFRSYDVPFTEHRAMEGGHKPMSGPGLQRERRVQLTVSWSTQERRTAADVMITDREGRSAIQRLEAPGRNGAQTLFVFRNTWLEVLKTHCKQFCAELLWSEAEALAFVMSGRTPEIKPVRAEAAVATDNSGQPLRTEVTLRVQPFVSIDSIDRMLAEVRIMLGRRIRPGPPMAHRTLALFEFVEDSVANAGPTAIPWNDLVRDWDHRHRRDKWGYGGDRRNFRRDFERARRLLLEDYLPPRQHQEVLEARTSRGRPPRRAKR
jgi:hypothetical protein